MRFHVSSILKDIIMMSANNNSYFGQKKLYNIIMIPICAWLIIFYNIIMGLPSCGGVRSSHMTVLPRLSVGSDGQLCPRDEYRLSQHSKRLVTTDTNNS